MEMTRAQKKTLPSFRAKVKYGRGTGEELSPRFYYGGKTGTPEVEAKAAAKRWVIDRLDGVIWWGIYRCFSSTSSGTMVASGN